MFKKQYKLTLTTSDNETASQSFWTKRAALRAVGRVSRLAFDKGFQATTDEGGVNFTRAKSDAQV